jgi:hypothetical protein
MVAAKESFLPQSLDALIYFRKYEGVLEGDIYIVKQGAVWELSWTWIA